METLAKKELGFLTDVDMSNTFDAEMVAEWVVDGSYTDNKIAALSDEDFAAVEENIADRWSENKADAFGDRWIELTS